MAGKGATSKAGGLASKGTELATADILARLRARPMPSAAERERAAALFNKATGGDVERQRQAAADAQRRAGGGTKRMSIADMMAMDILSEHAFKAADRVMKKGGSDKDRRKLSRLAAMLEGGIGSATR